MKRNGRRSGAWRPASAAFEEAARLDSGYVGPHHVLLALLRPGEETVAAQALRDSGADYEKLSTAVAGHRAELEHRGITMNAAAHTLVGRAEGIAAGLGAEAVAAEHVLLAIVWDDRDWSLSAAGTTREAVCERLQDQGVSLPGKQPAARPRSSGPEQLVYFPQVQLFEVLAGLPKLMPADADWGWNLDGPFRAWVRGKGDFDLRELVRRALDGVPA